MQISKKEIEKLSKIDLEKVGRAEENVKIKITVPLFELLGYDKVKDMDFEHNVRNKWADIALMFKEKPKAIIETKELESNLDEHIDQALSYGYRSGVKWVILTNGVEIRVYQSFLEGVEDPNDRLIICPPITLKELVKRFNELEEYFSKDSLLTEKRLNKKSAEIRANITAKILIKDLAECKKTLFNDLYSQFKERYEKDESFKKTINQWAEIIKININDPDLIEKLCKEGAYTLINRVLFLRICEDKGYIKPKISQDAFIKLREMVEKPSNLLHIAFKEIRDRFEGLYRSPIFDNIDFEDINWDEETINFIIERMSQYDFANITKDIIGAAYEQHISREERKRLGQFYTPDFVIDSILDNTLEQVLQKKPVEEIKILDPACGSGGFLMKAYDRLKKKYIDEGWLPSLIHKTLLKKNLFGIDINPFATQLTVMNLLLKDLDHPTGEINVIEGDTLEKLELSFDFEKYQKESPLKAITRADKKMSQGMLLIKHMPFDIVMGNPPYITFGTKGTYGYGKLKKDYLYNIRKNYPNSAEYKISIYAVFIERGLELLANNGLFGFIIPDSFLIGKYFSKIRKYILNNCCIKEIILFSKDFWKYGVVGLPVILILEKELDKEIRKRNEIVAKLIFDVPEAENVKSLKYDQKYFENLKFNQFRLFFDPISKEIVDKMENNSVELGKKGEEILEFHIGIRVKGDQRKAISINKKGDNWKRALISGSEINRYSIKYSGNFINIDPDILWSGGWNKDIIKSEKLLIRRTGDSIIATIDSEGFYHLGNLHNAILKNYDFDLKYILAIINSKLMNYYYHITTLKLHRVLAQIDHEILKQIPIKPISMDDQQEIINVVDNLLSLYKKLYDYKYFANKSEIEIEINKNTDAIDQKVYKLYGLSNEEIQTVESANKY